MEQEKIHSCPHCNQTLKKWLCPPETSWSSEFQYVCFNDECSYYVRGWNWMKEKFSQNISYRYRLNPINGESGPIPVWSKDALKNFIIE